MDVFQHRFWKAFLKMFAPFWTSFLNQFCNKNAFKNLSNFGEKTVKRVKRIRHLKYTLPALSTRFRVPLGKGWVGVEKYNPEKLEFDLFFAALNALP